jgi:hypothetical protein
LFFKGTETIINLRSLLTYKTAELNEIIHDLQLIDQVLTNVENGTEQIETVLKEVVNSTGQQDTKLLDAEATLDSAIQSAYRLYSIEDEYSASLLLLPLMLTLSFSNPLLIVDRKRDFIGEDSLYSDGFKPQCINSCL